MKTSDRALAEFSLAFVSMLKGSPCLCECGKVTAEEDGVCNFCRNEPASEEDR